MFIFPVQLTTSRIGNLTRLIHTLLYVMTIHTLTLLALDYSPSDRPDCHKNSLRFTKIKFQEKKIAFERHAEQRERSAQKNKKYIISSR